MWFCEVDYEAEILRGVLVVMPLDSSLQRELAQPLFKRILETVQLLNEPPVRLNVTLYAISTACSGIT